MSKDRAEYLDSLRGVAAMLVVTAHFLAAFYPYAVFGGGTAAMGPFSAHAPWEVAAHWPPLSLLTAGHFAVCLFFVLSGYVLSYRWIGESAQGRRIVGAIIKRPFRLGGLTLSSILIGALLWQAGWLFHVETGSMAGSAPWLSLFWVGEFSWTALWHDLIRARAGFEYNPPLWTIKIEVIGSFLVFFVLLAISRLAWVGRTIALIALLIATYGSYYDGFVIGMLFADASKRRLLAGRNPKISLQPAVFWVATLSVIVVAGYPYYAAKAIFPPSDWLMNWVTPHISMFAAALVFALVHGTPEWRRWLSQRYLIWLGHVSFAVYVLHFLLMASFTAWLVLLTTPLLGYGTATALAAIVSLPLLLWMSTIATRWIDEPSINLGRKIEQWADRNLLARVTYLGARNQ